MQSVFSSDTSAQLLASLATSFMSALLTSFMTVDINEKLPNSLHSKGYGESMTCQLRLRSDIK